MISLIVSVFACTSDSVPEKLIVYSGRSEKLVGELLERAEADLGFQIDIQYGKTPDMVNKLLLEGEQSPADVVFVQDSGHLGALASKNLLHTLDDDLRRELVGF